MALGRLSCVRDLADAPARRVAAPLLAEVRELVEDVVVKPPGTPPQWTGAHADLTPWNLRRARGRSWLIDWEDARWAPPGFDQIYWTITPCPEPERAPTSLPWTRDLDEAREQWRTILAGRDFSPSESDLNRRLVTLLG